MQITYVCKFCNLFSKIDQAPAQGWRLEYSHGALYAMTRIEVSQSWDDIPGTWQKLVKWMEASKYRHGRHQWLEEHIGPLGEMGGDQPFTLDLHLPITE